VHAPPGTVVLLDGKANQDPANLTFTGIKAGSHQLVVAAPAHEAVSQIVSVEAGKTEVIRVELVGQDGAAPK
jgi:hypothetical protein